MALRYKVDILAALKYRGYPTPRLRKEKLLSEYTIQGLREKRNISMNSLDVICGLLGCQPGDLIEYIGGED